MATFHFIFNHTMRMCVTYIQVKDIDQINEIWTPPITHHPDSKWSVSICLLYLLRHYLDQRSLYFRTVKLIMLLGINFFFFLVVRIHSSSIYCLSNAQIQHCSIWNVKYFRAKEDYFFFTSLGEHFLQVLLGLCYQGQRMYYSNSNNITNIWTIWTFFSVYRLLIEPYWYC